MKLNILIKLILSFTPYLLSSAPLNFTIEQSPCPDANGCIERCEYTFKAYDVEADEIPITLKGKITVNTEFNSSGDNLYFKSFIKLIPSIPGIDYDVFIEESIFFNPKTYLPKEYYQHRHLIRNILGKKYLKGKWVKTAFTWESHGNTSVGKSHSTKLPIKKEDLQNSDFIFRDFMGTDDDAFKNPWYEKFTLLETAGLTKINEEAITTNIDENLLFPTFAAFHHLKFQGENNSPTYLMFIPEDGRKVVPVEFSTRETCSDHRTFEGDVFVGGFRCQDQKPATITISKKSRLLEKVELHILGLEEGIRGSAELQSVKCSIEK